MEYKNNYLEAEFINLVTRDWNMRQAGQTWIKGAKWKLCRMTKSKDLIYSMMTTVNSIVLKTKNSLTLDFRYSH